MQKGERRLMGFEHAGGDKKVRSILSIVLWRQMIMENHTSKNKCAQGTRGIQDICWTQSFVVVEPPYGSLYCTLMFRIDELFKAFVSGEKWDD